MTGIELEPDEVAGITSLELAIEFEFEVETKVNEFEPELVLVMGFKLELWPKVVVETVLELKTGLEFEIILLLVIELVLDPEFVVSFT